MTEDELSELDKEVKRRKRVAGEWAAQLHDLVEERLPAAYKELPSMAQSAYEACEAWADAERALRAARS